ncbi:MAG TPA: hypothetical protein VMV26_04140 [Alphaproteobacteria bacterium]|nr:hypothetical protein [Alphaproteobacteria bacterium]
MLRPTMLLIAAAVALAACATRENYEQGLNGWIGHKTDELAASWGPPTSTHNLGNGGAIMTYDSERTRYIPTGALTEPSTVYIKGTPVDGGYTSTYGGSTGYTIQRAPVVIRRDCVTSFTSDSAGKITGWTADGDDCTG